MMRFIRKVGYRPGFAGKYQYIMLAVALAIVMAPAQAATLVVNDNSDPGTQDDLFCSLREAVTSINAVTADTDDCEDTTVDGFGTNDTIIFDSTIASPIVLGGTEIPINKPIKITGPGQSMLSISGDSLSRIFNISNTTSPTTISGLMLTNGFTAFDGGAITSKSNLTLDRVTLVANTATGSGGALNLSLESGRTATLTNCTISDNTAASGGGVFMGPSGQNVNGIATLTDCNISGNMATSGDGGGLLVNKEFTATLTRSTVSENTAAGDGGGLQVNQGGTTTYFTTLVNSTVSGNTAGGEGGGLNVNRSKAELTNTTIAFNKAGTLPNGTAGGGLRVNGRNATGGGNPQPAQPGTAVINNVILAQNSGEGLACTTGNQSTVTTSSATSNLATARAIGTCTNTTTLKDLTTELLLGPLAINGGTTRTHALLAGSHAIDTGAAVPCPTSDQRSIPRPLDGDGLNAAECDIGAFEFIDPANPILDLGDADDDATTPVYPTLLSSNGAAHLKTGMAPWLGATVDHEPDGQPTAAADGDDLDTTDDEDAIGPIILTAGTTTNIDVDVTDAIGSYLSVWIDFNQDGDWDDAGEQLLDDVVLVAATEAVSVTIDPSAVSGIYILRARVCSAMGDCNSPRGLSSDGEVEDHAITVVNNSGSSRTGGGGDSCDSYKIFGWCTGVGAADHLTLLLIGLFGLWRRVNYRH